MRIRVQTNGMQNKLEMDVEHDANADANTNDSHNNHHNNNRIVELWGEKNRLKIEILRIITRHRVFAQRLLYGPIMQVILF